MKILNAQVDWHPEFDNEPTLTIWVDGVPKHDDLRYEKKGGFFFAEGPDGYCAFVYDDPNNHEGFGGREFVLNMKDGTVTKLRGPWSGNGLSARAAGFPLTYPCTGCYPSPHGTEWRASVDLLEDVWLKTIETFCPDAAVVITPSANPSSPMCSAEQNHAIGHGLPPKLGEHVYAIVRKGMTVGQTWAYKRALRMKKWVNELHDFPVYIKGDPTPAEHQRKQANYVNGLVAEFGLEAFGVAKLDLENLPPILPRKPEPVYASYNPEEEADL